MEDREDVNDEPDDGEGQWNKISRKNKRKKISPAKQRQPQKIRCPSKIANFIEDYLLGTATRADSLTRSFTTEIEAFLNDSLGDKIVMDGANSL